MTLLPILRSRALRHASTCALGLTLLTACSGSKDNKPGPLLPFGGSGDAGAQNDAAVPGTGDGDFGNGDGDVQSGDGDFPGGDGDVPGGDGGAPGSADAGVDGGSVVPGPFEGEGEPWLKPAPRAACAEGDAPDKDISGLNGDVSCNVSIAGQVAAPHFLSLAWYHDCAYVNGNDGTTVIHVSEAGTPTITTTLTELGFRSNWESMKASEASGLLAGYESNGAALGVYDVAADCKQPVHQSTIRLGGSGTSIGHAGSFSPDGTLYYASSMYTATVFAVDLAVPMTPVVRSSEFERSAHDLFVGKAGNRGYFAYPNLAGNTGVGALAIMDLTDVQARKKDAKGKLIKELSWEDGNISQYPIAISYRGKDYVMITDELGSGACGDPKKPQWGYARIFDISDETNPKLVSLIKTEAQDPANCQTAEKAEGSVAGFGLGTHYCNVDRLQDPRLLTCGNWGAGVRVYDIRNPWRPKEVAYFNRADGTVPGLQRIVPEKRELWLAMVPGTFYVLKFRPGSAVDEILSE